MSYRNEDKILARKFVYNVRKRMEELDMTQGELAKRSDNSQSYISFILREERVPTLVFAVRIARALGVDLQDLLK